MPIGKNRATSSEHQDDSWRKLLTAETTPLFNTLREWRAGKAKTEGVPPYFIATNRQLAEIIWPNTEFGHFLVRDFNALFISTLV